MSGVISGAEAILAAARKPVAVEFDLDGETARIELQRCSTASRAGIMALAAKARKRKSEDDPGFGLEFSVAVLRACLPAGMSEETVEQLLFVSGGPLGPLAAKAMELCGFGKPDAKGRPVSVEGAIDPVPSG